ncbi:hypothetical protein AB0H76_17600 [Nocardia sp. NPDC050712]|uniref:hypothetical protein n=1 Tax=Nocardia sp. NPDC050712 TaxID=3155518 RepID=UPI0033DB699A
MTTGVDVDVDVYYSGAKALLDWSRAWWSAIDKSLSALSGFGDMAGTHSDGEIWASSYDQRIIDTLQLVSSTATAVHNYGAILAEMGYNHAIAEHAATLNAGAAPEKPSVPQLAVSHCLLPPPAAGGPGQGLVDSGIGLLEQLNIIVPDGDRDKLDGARDAWTKIASLEATTNFPVAIEAVARAFEACSTPESSSIDEDLRALKASAEAITKTFEDLAASCQDHRDALDDLRAKLVSQLTGMAQAFATEMAINAAISIASSWVTFGVSVAAGVAGAALIVKRYSKPILEMIDAWRSSRNLNKGVRSTQDFSKHKSEMQRIEELSKTRTRPSSWNQLTDIDQEILRRGASDAQGKSLSGMLRRGENLTPQQQRDVDALNQAMNKLPTHEGPLVRHTRRTPEELARYEPDKPVQELGFTSASRNPAGSNDLLVESSNVEFQLISKTGKDMSQYGTPDEVLFHSGTNFFVHSKTIDPVTGRTVIKMAEI